MKRISRQAETARQLTCAGAYATVDGNSFSTAIDRDGSSRCDEVDALGGIVSILGRECLSKAYGHTESSTPVPGVPTVAG
jgi:hypothetical protein